jgi:hypothetical protein
MLSFYGEAIYFYDDVEALITSAAALKNKRPWFIQPKAF